MGVDRFYLGQLVGVGVDRFYLGQLVGVGVDRFYLGQLVGGQDQFKTATCKVATLIILTVFSTGVGNGVCLYTNIIQRVHATLQ